MREVREETGVAVRILREVEVPGERGYRCFAAELVGSQLTPEAEEPVPDIHVIDTAWHEVSPDQPLGPMQPRTGPNSPR